MLSRHMSLSHQPEQQRCAVVLVQGGEYVFGVRICDSMREGRELASYMRRHHLLGEGVEVRAVRDSELPSLF